jgi:hypothetical protein
MKTSNGSILAGVLLIGGGILLLLQNLGLLRGAGFLWAVFCVLGGLACFGVYAIDRARWWAAIPGGALLALGVTVALDVAGGAFARWAGTAFLATVGLGFAIVVLGAPRARWWATIPAGALFTLAAVAALDQFGSSEAGGATFFLGLALTFFVVALLPQEGKGRDWALVPAVACLALGLLVAATAMAAFTWLWAVLLIAAGLGLLARTRLTAPF